MVLVQVDGLCLLIVDNDIVLALWQGDLDLTGAVGESTEDLTAGVLVDDSNGGVVKGVTVGRDTNSERA